MDYSKLYHSILTSQWALAPKIAYNFFPQLDQLVSNHKFVFATEEKKEKKPSMILDFYDQDNSKIDRQENVTPDGSIAVLQIVGTLIKYGNPYCWGADEYAMIIRQLMADPSIQGIVLYVDSGGGSVDAIAPIQREILARTKPVVVLADLCASAAVYFSVFADHIMADNAISSEFGSIGVMISFRDYSDYYKKNGVKEHVIYAPESDYKNKPFELALEGKYDLIKQEMLSPLAKGFQETVKLNRKKLNTEVEGILRGRMFYAQDALEAGLIDSIGDMPAAFREVRRLSSISELRSGAQSFF